MIELLNVVIVMAAFTAAVEIFIHKFDKGMVFFAIFKTFFYGALAFFVYLYAKKVGLDLSAPEDWLTLFTFILAVFETAHNLVIFICSLRGDKES